jgi:hypothetical protein
MSTLEPISRFEPMRLGFSDASFLPLQSPSIAKIADALSKAQAKMKPAKKSRDNTFFKSSYADLASVIEASRPLQEFGIAITQTLLPVAFEVGTPQTFLVTTLTHSSGEFVRSYLPFQPPSADPQKIGSYFTYMRRYTLQAIAGIAAEGEDDDGNAASDETASSKTTNDQKMKLKRTTL